MSREILFRAKRLNWQELPGSEWWVEGLPGYDLYGKLTDFEVYKGFANCNVIEIAPGTLCEYTGLTDEKGRKIFEGDIVAFLDTYSTDSGMAEGYCTGCVKWDDDELCFYVTNRLSAESWEVLNECKVIGNMFDNPELLEGEVTE